MRLLNNKRAEAITLILIAVVITLFSAWVISLNFNSKECRSNSQCQSGFYCGSDFSCHEMPVIERTLKENNLILPSIIIGIAIVAAAFVLRARNSSKNNKSPERNHASHNEPDKPHLKTP